MVKIVQLLCPQRHCLLGIAYEEEHSSFREACGAITSMMTEGPFNNWCAICGSHDLHFEERATEFHTLLEAAPYLGMQSAANAQSRAAMDAAGLTYDTQRKN